MTGIKKQKIDIDIDNINIGNLMSDVVRRKLLSIDKKTGKYLYEVFIERLVEKAVKTGGTGTLAEIKRLMIKLNKSERPKTDLSFIGSMFDDVI